MKRKMNFNKLLSLCLVVMLIFLTACQKENADINADANKDKLSIEELSFREHESSYQMKKVVYDKEENKVSFDAFAQVDDSEISAVFLNDGRAVLDALNFSNIKNIMDKGKIEGILTYGDGYFAALKKDSEFIFIELVSDKTACEEIGYEDFINGAVAYLEKNGDTVLAKLGFES